LPEIFIRIFIISKHHPYTIVWHQSLAEIDRAVWDALAVPLQTPFLEWRWLNLMETSGSITRQAGWLPSHLTVWDDNRLVGAAPLYAKSHSAGEFVFDHTWADFSERMGIRYYPKLVGMSPVTPVSGYRFLIAPDVETKRLTTLMIDEIHRFCMDNRLSGCSFLFVDPEWRSLLSHCGFTAWTHQGFVWNNRGCLTFDDYLSGFNTNQRHNIRRERNKVSARGVVIKSYSGDEIPPRFFPVMHSLYERTNDKFGPWSCKYLRGEFFHRLHEQYRHRLVMVAAFEETHHQDPVGMSLLVTKNDRLFGRYWGSFKEIENLHFNVCYYEPIRWAIEHSVRHFDPGLGGPHKCRRGFVAVPTYSLHRFYDPRMRWVMANHIDEINRLEKEQIENLNRSIPFSHSGKK